MDELPSNTMLSAPIPGADDSIKMILAQLNPSPPAQEPPKPEEKPEISKTPDQPKVQDLPKPKGDVPESIKSTKAADDFRKLKAERDNYSREVEELKKTISESPQMKSKLEALEKERNELSERLKLLDIERHPEFNKKHETRIGGAESAIKSTVGQENADQVMALLKQPQSNYRDEKLSDIIEGLPTAKRLVLGAQIVRYQEALNERDSEIQEARKNYEAFQAKYREQQSGALQQAASRSVEVFEKVFKGAKELEIFSDRENDSQWAEELKGREALARQIFAGQNTEEDLAKAALWAAAAPKYRELLYSQMEINKKLQAENDKLRGSSPSLAATTKSAPTPAAGPNSNNFINEVLEKMRGGI